VNVLKAFGEPAVKRQEHCNIVPEQINEFRSHAKDMIAMLDSNYEKFSHGKEEDREPVCAEIGQFFVWLDKLVAELETLQRSKDSLQTEDPSTIQARAIKERRQRRGKEKRKTRNKNGRLEN
jgi:hypothetical protein